MAMNGAKTSEKPEILSLDNDDIGEVGEWVGKSANIHAKNEEDEDDDDEEKNKSDDFDDIFDNPKQRNPQNGLQASEANEKIEKQNSETFKAQSNIAMQKAQGSSAFKTGKNRTGPFLNNLKEKATNFKKAEELIDGEIKVKAESKTDLLAIEEHFKEKGIDISGIKSVEGLELNFAEPEHIKEHELSGEEESPRPIITKKSTNTEKKVIEKIEIEYSSDKVTQESPNKQEEKVIKPEIKNKHEKSNDDKFEPNDWDLLSIEVRQQQQAKQKEPMDKEKKLLDFREAWDSVCEADLYEEKRQVRKEIDSSQTTFEKLFFSCTRKTLPESLADERCLILVLAKIPFNDNVPVHFEILETIYKKLTGEKGEVPRMGPHWKKIGFQDRDPATDFRGVGILGILQILAFLTNHEKIYKKMWMLSIDKERNFPLSICGFSITLEVMRLLRTNKLNSIFLDRHSVKNPFNELYFATFYKLYKIYETNNYTIQEYPLAKSVALEALRTSHFNVLREFERDSKHA